MSSPTVDPEDPRELDEMPMAENPALRAEVSALMDPTLLDVPDEAPPSEPPAESEAEAGVDTPAEAAPEEAPVADPATPPTAPQVAPAPVQPPPPDELTMLRAQVEALKGTIAGLQQQPPPQPQQQQAAPGQPGAAPDPDAAAPGTYAVAIPQQLADGLLAEDPNTRGMALQQLMAGMGDYIHRTVVKAVREQVLPQFQEQILGQTTQVLETRERAKDINTDYYGRFPTHNHAQIKPMVAATAQAVMAELGTNTWSEYVREETGRRVSAALAHASGVPQAVAPQGGAAPAAPAAPGNAAPPAGPPPQFGSGTRPSTNRGRSSATIQQADIANTLGFTR